MGPTLVKSVNATYTPHADTAIPSIPACVRDIMAALLKTPPPPAGSKATRKVVKRKGRKKR